MNKRAKTLLYEIKRLNKMLYKCGKELKKIQGNCAHHFPDFEERRKTRKVFAVVCSKCGYSKTVSEYAAIV